MASKTSKSGQTREQDSITESTDAQFPELTVQAEGTANRLQRVNTCLSVSEFVPNLTWDSYVRKLRFEERGLMDKCKIQQR
ncbi:hypothetical protein ACODNH_21660 (plasmid) [Haloarcula sp. NS06]|uniref:hypothetical protein n=1 Tax=Haloarcula sp. NS06 TaxID=3409688 RepID=UPI003DA72748